MMDKKGFYRIVRVGYSGFYWIFDKNDRRITKSPVSLIAANKLMKDLNNGQLKWSIKTCSLDTYRKMVVND